MNPPKVTDLDYINFLVASPLVFSCTKATRVQSARSNHRAQLKSNRQVDPARTENCALRAVAIAAARTVVHLTGYGVIKVFRIVVTDSDTEHWATDDLTMEVRAQAELVN
jgi:hypothetical protein